MCILAVIRMSSLTPQTMQNNRFSPDLSSGVRPDLAIVMVHWNVREYLLRNLRALEHSVGDFTAQVMVVDNASTDGSVQEIRAEFPWVTVIENKENLGFARACNQGMALSKARHLLLLNPDTCVEPDTLSKSIEYADADPRVGVFSVRLVREDGSEVRSVRRFPDLWSQVLTMLKLAKFFPRLVGRYLAEDLDLSREQEVDSVRGAYFFIHERVLQALGGLDERYFIWFEEVDYCRRAHERGFSVRHVPSIRITDAVGKSFSQRRLFWKQRQLSRSMILYFSIWEPWWQTWVLRLMWVPVLAIAWVMDPILSRRKV